MRSLWSDGDAAAIVARYGAAGVVPDLALRVYTSRLLGGDPRLVLHGGGNTSVKTRARDDLGQAGREHDLVAEPLLGVHQDGLPARPLPLAVEELQLLKQPGEFRVRSVDVTHGDNPRLGRHGQRHGQHQQGGAQGMREPE